MSNTKLIEFQCELYRILLYPNQGTENAEPYIKKALELVTRIVGARVGYIEFSKNNGESWSAYHGESDEEKLIRDRISNTIITESMSSDEIIMTASAFLDDRFEQAASVMAGRIESVLCAPLNSSEIAGVVYLQGDLNSSLLENHKVVEAKFFSRNIQPLLRQLAYRFSGDNQTHELRKTYKLDGLIGASQAFHRILNQAMTIAPLDVTLLLTGATGTGKTHLAKVIHRNSPRAAGKFIHLNCANIPEQLFESELFGAAKGAFSGANSSIKGKIMAAEGGTLFLDEISEMPVKSQAKLLQFLEEGCFYSLGSSVPLSPDVRIIVASNIDFQECIKDGTFREDLYFRIAPFPLRVPSLYERIEDLQELAEFFLASYSERFNYQNCHLSADSLTALSQYSWPGNIRELQNRLQQGLIKAKIEGSQLIKCSHVLSDQPLFSEDECHTHSFSEERDKWERNFLTMQLKQNEWNISQTAGALDMSRSYLNKLIKEYNLEKPLD